MYFIFLMDHWILTLRAPSPNLHFPCVPLGEVTLPLQSAQEEAEPHTGVDHSTDRAHVGPHRYLNQTVDPEVTADL